LIYFINHIATKLEYTNFPKRQICRPKLLIGYFCKIKFALGRYSTFQYPDQDAYQYPYPEDFNADTLFHVSVSVKRICRFLPCLNSAYKISLSFTWKFNTCYPNVVTSKLVIIYTCPIARIRCISGRLWIWYIMRK